VEPVRVCISAVQRQLQSVRCGIYTLTGGARKPDLRRAIRTTFLEVKTCRNVQPPTVIVAAVGWLVVHVMGWHARGLVCPGIVTWKLFVGQPATCDHANALAPVICWMQIQSGRSS
jgi:hypothetical protein